MKVTRKVMKKDEEPYDEDFVVDRDECNRPTTTLEGLNEVSSPSSNPRRAAR